MTDPISGLRTRFRWTRDARDRWTLLDAPEGPLAGDCEDFALTAAWLVCDRSWARFWGLVLTFRAVFWWTRLSSGEGHWMLWMAGRGWIDCNHPDFGPRRYPRLMPLLPPALALRLLRMARLTAA